MHTGKLTECPARRGTVFVGQTGLALAGDAPKVLATGDSSKAVADSRGYACEGGW